MAIGARSQRRAPDGETTAIDTDGAFRLDTAQGHLHIRDDARGALGAFDIEARVTQIQ
ncbi:MAG: hypothetical protein JRH11_26090 [Deltaproteobacteria bacterium]|nr:hypothetical protein [Deltaproteobacteria bacterium]